MNNHPSTPAPFQDGDTIAFHGDSITHSGLYAYYLEAILRTRYPRWRCDFFNAGMSGGSAKWGLERLDGDILARRPTWVFVAFGMNDVGRPLYASDRTDAASLRERQACLDTYRQSLTETITRTVAVGARPFLLTPTPYDQYSDLPEPAFPGCNDGLVRCAEICLELAGQHHIPIIDIHTPLTKIVQDHPELKMQADRVHMTPVGHLLTAYLLARALGVPPLVAQVAIDAGLQRVLASDNADIRDLSCAAGSEAFRYAPRALPLPEFPESTQADTLVPFFKNLDQEQLILRGLPPGRCRLSCNGQETALADAADLAAGINLARLPTNVTKFLLR